LTDVLSLLFGGVAHRQERMIGFKGIKDFLRSFVLLQFFDSQLTVVKLFVCAPGMQLASYLIYFIL
jgi:hypothetical protein